MVPFASAEVRKEPRPGRRGRIRPARAARARRGQRSQRPAWRPGRNQSDQTVPSVRYERTVWASRPPSACSRRRQRDRAEVMDPGQRVAAVGQVPQVPVAAPGQRRDGRHPERPPAPAPGRDRRQADDQHRRRQQEVELGPRRETRRQPDARPAPLSTARRSIPFPSLPAVRPSPRPTRSAPSPRRPAGRRSRRCRSSPPPPGRAAPARSAPSPPAPATRPRPGTAGRCTSRPRRHPRSQPRFSSGDSRSREKASIPVAWNTSPFAG